MADRLYNIDPIKLEALSAGNGARQAEEVLTIISKEAEETLVAMLRLKKIISAPYQATTRQQPTKEARGSLVRAMKRLGFPG